MEYTAKRRSRLLTVIFIYSTKKSILVAECMSMEREPRLGEFEFLILLAILRLGDAAYGASVKRLLSDEIGRDVSIGALYATIERLEGKAMLSSKMGEPTPERGGRAKSYLRVTAKGQAAVRRSRENLTTLWQGLEFRVAGQSPMAVGLCE